MQAFNNTFYYSYSFVSLGFIEKGHATPIQDALFNDIAVVFKINSYDLI